MYQGVCASLLAALPSWKLLTLFLRSVPLCSSHRANVISGYQCGMVAYCLRFGTTYWSHLQGSRRSHLHFSWTPSHLKIGPIICTEMSVRTYHSRLCKILAERRSHLCGGVSVRPRDAQQFIALLQKLWFGEPARAVRVSVVKAVLVDCCYADCGPKFLLVFLL